jgi:hypothetical protein
MNGEWKSGAERGPGVTPDAEDDWQPVLPIALEDFFS